MSKCNPINQVLKEVLIPIRFSRKGDSWYRRTGDVVQVVNLQKSQYGNQYYLNYALWLLALGESSFPREEKCHVRFRIEDISTNEDQYKELLNLEFELDNERRTVLLQNALSSDLLPFIERTGAGADVQKCFNEGALRKGMVHIDAKRLFESTAGK